MYYSLRAGVLRMDLKDWFHVLDFLYSNWQVERVLQKQTLLPGIILFPSDANVEY